MSEVETETKAEATEAPAAESAPAAPETPSFPTTPSKVNIMTLKVDDEKGPSQSARAVTCSGRRASQGTHLKFTDQ